MVVWWKQAQMSFRRKKGKDSSSSSIKRSSALDEVYRNNNWSLSYVDHVGFTRVDGTILKPETMVWYRGIETPGIGGDNADEEDDPEMKTVILVENIGIVKPNKRAMKTQYAKLNEEKNDGEEKKALSKAAKSELQQQQQIAAVETMSTSSSMVHSLTGLSRYMDRSHGGGGGMYDAPSLSLRSTSTLSTAKKKNKSSRPQMATIPMVSKILTNVPSTLAEGPASVKEKSGRGDDEDDDVDSELMFFQKRDGVVGDEHELPPRPPSSRSRASAEGSKHSRAGSRRSGAEDSYSWASVSTISTNPGRREMLMRKKRLIEQELALMDRAAPAGGEDGTVQSSAFSRASGTTISSLGSALSFTEKRISAGDGARARKTSASSRGSQRSRRSSPPKVIGPAFPIFKSSSSSRRSTASAASSSSRAKKNQSVSSSSSARSKSSRREQARTPPASTPSTKAITQAFLAEFELPDLDNVVDDLDVLVRGRAALYCGEVLRSGTKTEPHTASSTKGLIKFGNGEMYLGPMEHGEMHGSGGKYLFSSQGDMYTGDFFHNQRQGKAEFTTGHGRRYVGMYHEDAPHGKGVLYNADGSVFFMGDWNRGKPKRPIKTEKERLELMLPVPKEGVPAH